MKRTAWLLAAVLLACGFLTKSQTAYLFYGVAFAALLLQRDARQYLSGVNSVLAHAAALAALQPVPFPQRNLRQPGGRILGQRCDHADLPYALPHHGGSAVGQRAGRNRMLARGLAGGWLGSRAGPSAGCGAQ